MPSELITDRLLSGYLCREAGCLNTQLPRRRKSLSELMAEEAPQVLLADGSTHFFRKKELREIAAVVDSAEHSSMLLPLIIEVRSAEGDIAIQSETPGEGAMLAVFAGMPLAERAGCFWLSRRQVGILRRRLRTTTQYVFIA
ncbi:MAG: DUF61 family protein [Deltaproteobacteria bacterium]|nr:DUF61 family protein [Deltaproteobacteria bacterium]